MTLLDFARGPAMYWSVLILVGGMLWRLSGVFLLPHKRNLAEPRRRPLAVAYGAVKTIVSRTLPRKTFRQRTAVSVTLGYAFHAGLLIILLGGAPHILLLKTATGLSWPPLPKGIVALASGVTLTTLAIVCVRRMIHPVLRLLSNVDDYLSLLLTFIPVLTGILLAEETFGNYELLLAVHILSVEAFMVWLPFGKLAHMVFVFLGRATLGAKFARKGAAT